MGHITHKLGRPRLWAAPGKYDKIFTVTRRMKEIIFIVEEADEGGYVARALGHSIVTEADDLESLNEMVRDAVKCHFDEEESPKVIRLHFVREEIISV